MSAFAATEAAYGQPGEIDTTSSSPRVDRFRLLPQNHCVSLTPIRTPSTWPADIPFDPARKRYYRPDLDFTRAIGGFQFLNAEEVFFMSEAIHGVRYPLLAGARRIQVPGRPRLDTYGLPPTRSRPKLKVGTRNRPLDVYAMNQIFVSTRARELLSAIDAEAFEFIECDTRSRKGVEVEPYWMMAIIRPVEAFDEDRSVFTIVKGFDGVTNEPYEGPYFSDLYDIHMLPGLDERFHAFFFPRYPRAMIFDEVLADEWRARRLSGWVMTPLQPPTPKERQAGKMGGTNFSYWYRGDYRKHRRPEASSI